MFDLNYIGDSGPGFDLYLTETSVVYIAQQVKKSIKKGKPINPDLLDDAWEAVSFLAPKNEYLIDVQADTLQIQGIIHACTGKKRFPAEGLVVASMYARWCMARLECVVSEFPAPEDAPEDDGKIHHSTYEIDSAYKVNLGLIHASQIFATNVPERIRERTGEVLCKVIRDIANPVSDPQKYEVMAQDAENLLSWWLYFANHENSTSFAAEPVLAACERILAGEDFDMNDHLLLISYLTYKRALEAPRPWPCI